MKIRHFGLLANRNRRRALELCRAYLRSTTNDLASLLSQQQRSALNRSCPKCLCGTLHVVARNCVGQPIAIPAVSHPATVDSS